MGTGSGSGMGMGTGPGGSAGRGGNVGLYGAMPGMAGRGGGNDAEGRQGSGDDTEGGFASEFGGENPDSDSLIDTIQTGSAGGIGEGAIPIRYRRPVGEYFQRVADEIGDR